MDIVFIRELKIDTVIGIYDWEQRFPQQVVLDLEMGLDLKAAAKSGKIDDTLDYKAVAKRIQQHVSGSKFGLVETIAEQVADIVLKEFKVRWVKITLNKPGAVSGSKSVGVAIERGKKE
jgi:7,8-dihydroneopterin aldolase/epimerase/oxygenase